VERSRRLDEEQVIAKSDADQREQRHQRDQEDPGHSASFPESARAAQSPA
jgi:hypothetical protein